MKKIRTLILVADGGHGKFYLNEGVHKGVTLVEEYDNKLNYTRELGVDKPGRTFESADGARHAMAPRVDFHDQEKKTFAHFLSDKLNHKVSSKEIDRIIIVAPPKILPELRNHLNNEAKQILVGELNKDLTKVKSQDLPQHLNGIAVI